MLDDITLEDDYAPPLAVDEAVRIEFAFDRSMRTKDLDGHLHVEVVNISKANVCPYMGSEIPNGAELGLDPGRVYMLYRDAAELEAAAPTFENKQLLLRHVGVSAEAPQEWLTVGVVSGVHWVPPYLKARLTVWNQKGIDAIESERQQELSSGYRYKADMTPGIVDGEHYDGIMRQIVGNHVALVTEGRVGPDVFVTDELPEDFHTMKLSTLTAALVAASLIATDKKPEDVTKALSDALALDKKAKDEEIAKAAADAAKKDEEDCAMAAKDAGCEPKEMVKGADGKWVKDSKKGKDEDPDMDLSADDNSAAGHVDGRTPGKSVKIATGADAAKAHDEAVAAAVTAALAARDALHDARKDVEPVLGVVQYDSAEAVYGAALTHLGVDHAGVHASAYRALFQAHIKAKSAPVVGDAAVSKGNADLFPGYDRLYKR